MGKGGAPTTTQTTQNQNVGYTPTGLAGMQQIYNTAANVASTPYQPYGGQLVQGLNPTQTGAIGNISNIANNPLTSAQIQQYQNPYQQDVVNATMANINETNNQQMAQTTGQLTGAAGGVGADRIAVGQSELARQQGLASNQTLAGLNQSNYAQGLATAQQQQGFGLGANQAALGAGGVQQQTGQAGLTAQYQQYLQQLAFPYQQAQFLAVIGLPALGAMGGQQYQTGTANQTVTPPGMSWLQGIAGVGSIGAGLTSGLGGGSGSSPDMSSGKSPAAASGGRINPYADGGATDAQSQDDPFSFNKTIDLGKQEYSDNTEGEALKGVLGPSSYVPSATSPQAHDAVPSFAPMQNAAGQGSGASSAGNAASTASGLVGLGTTIAEVIPFLAALKRGGGVDGYDDGGAVPQQQGQNPYAGGAPPMPSMLGRPITQGALPAQNPMGSPTVNYGHPLPSMMAGRTPSQANSDLYAQAAQALQMQQIGKSIAAMHGPSSESQGPQVSVSGHEFARGGYANGGGDDTYAQPDKVESYLDRNWVDMPSAEDPVANEEVARRFPYDATQAPYPEANAEVARRFPTDMPAAHDPTPAENVSYRFPEELPAAKDKDDNPVRSAFAPIRDKISAGINGLLPSASADPSAADSPQRPQAASGFPAGADQMVNAPNHAPAFPPSAFPAQAANPYTPTPYTPSPPPSVTVHPNAQPQAAPAPRMAGPSGNPYAGAPSDLQAMANNIPQGANRPTVRGLMNNPDFWVRTGLNILSQNPNKGPLGAIASGVSGQVGEYDKWSNEDLSAKQKAQEMAHKLMQETLKYTKVDANTAARIRMEHERLQQSKNQLVNYQEEINGPVKQGWADSRNKVLTDLEGNQVHAGRIVGRNSQAGGQFSNADYLRARAQAAATPGNSGLPEAELNQRALDILNGKNGPQSNQQAAPPPVPKDRSALVVGQPYTTAKGIGVWNGQTFDLK